MRPKPDISTIRDREELDAVVIEFAHMFTVIQVNQGGFRRGEPNYLRSEHKTLDEALNHAQVRYDADEKKRGCCIYAVANFPGATNLQRMIATYPIDNNPNSYSDEGRKAKLKGKKKRIPKSLQNIPPPGTLPPSDRHFEGNLKVDTTKVVGKGQSQRAIRYSNRKGGGR